MSQQIGSRFGSDATRREVPASRHAAPGSHRIALVIEYDGAPFHGWQRQASPGVATVQGELERALSSVADQPVTLSCAGRTDAGVHAVQQVAHFDTTASRPERAWVQGANSHLPPGVRVQWAKVMAPSFHARYAALSRSYRYIVYNRPQRPALFHRKMTFFDRVLDEQLMHREAQCLVGEQDFSAFRAVACQSATPMRNVHRVAVSRHDHLVAIDITANAFLLHMVRNIAGALLELGCGRQPPGWLADVLRGCDRGRCAATAAPDGLYLAAVAYAPEWYIPAPQAQWW